MGRGACGAAWQRTPLSSKAQIFDPRTPLSSKAQAFVPTSQTEVSFSSWPFSIAPLYLAEEVPLIGGTEGVAPHGVVRSASHETVEMKDMQTKQLLEPNTTTRGRQLERGYCDTQLVGVWNLPTRTPSRTPSPNSSLHSHVSLVSRTPSPDSSLHSHVSLVSRTPSPDSSQGSNVSLGSYVNQLPVKHTFIHYDDKSSLDDEDDHYSRDAEINSVTSLKRTVSAPCLLMQNLVFALISTEGEEAQKTAQESAKKTRPSPQMQLAHESGSCVPCAYFHLKEDSCRMGEECKFCHICPADAVKSRRKQKVQARRREEARKQREAGSHCHNKKPKRA